MRLCCAASGRRAVAQRDQKSSRRGGKPGSACEQIDPVTAVKFAEGSGSVAGSRLNHELAMSTLNQPHTAQEPAPSCKQAGSGCARR